jgi:hypothetical protein
VPQLRQPLPPRLFSEESLDRLTFLWGETEGALYRIELLPSEAALTDRTETLRVHLSTGYIDLDNRFPDDEVRAWQPMDRQRRPARASLRALRHVPARGNRKRRIHDFRTRGEQPFTALIEAQFAEQPPQKKRPAPPQPRPQGAGLQRRSAKGRPPRPALEHSHARDLFRQVLALAAHELREQADLSAMQHLYPASSTSAPSAATTSSPIQRRSSTTRTTSHRSKARRSNKTIAMGNRGWLRPTKSFAKAIFRAHGSLLLYSARPRHDRGGPGISYASSRTFRRRPRRGGPKGHVPRLAPAAPRAPLLPPRRRRKRSDLGEGWAKPEGINAAHIARNPPQPLRRVSPTSLDGDRSRREGRRLVPARRAREGPPPLRERPLLPATHGLSLNLRLDGAWLRCQDCGAHPP